MPFVSVRWASVCPNIQQTVSACSEVLEAYGFEGACVWSHSFGCAVAAWLIRHRPHLVKGVVLVDPVVMCIHLHKLLFNFIYAKHAIGTMEGLFRSELFINNCLRRNFYWYTTAVFGEDLLPLCPSLIVLSEEDEGVPSGAACRMLQQLLRGERGEEAGGWRERAGGAGGSSSHSMKVVMLEGQGHGGFLSCAASQGLIASETALLYRQISLATSPLLSSPADPSRTATASSSLLSCSSFMSSASTEMEEVSQEEEETLRIRRGHNVCVCVRAHVNNQLLCTVKQKL
jgi:pimeloyl-ACP methyl ester carboxylesterase